MGYTHYWDHPEVDEESFKKFADDVRLVLKRSKVKVQYEYDEYREPEITNDVVRFNGVGDDGHETFVMNRKATEFEFCKTARKPYDEIVTACLLCAVDHLPGFDVRSDGYWGEWKEGADLYEKATGREAKCPFSEE